MDERLFAVELELAELRGRLSALPTPQQVIACMGALLAFVVAMLGCSLVILWSVAGH